MYPPVNNQQIHERQAKLNDGVNYSSRSWIASILYHIYNEIYVDYVVSKFQRSLYAEY